MAAEVLQTLVQPRKADAKRRIVSCSLASSVQRESDDWYVALGGLSCCEVCISALVSCSKRESCSGTLLKAPELVSVSPLGANPSVRLDVDSRKILGGVNALWFDCDAVRGELKGIRLGKQGEIKNKK
jgi:hypothetical protein